ncbi:MAG: hypothetical protein ABL928_11830 [Sphingorhabdus sp.]
MFGFLAGYRPKCPDFTVWTDALECDDSQTFDSGELSIGGLRWKHNKFPHPIERIHICGRHGVTLKIVLTAFAANRSDFVTRIAAVEDVRYFSRMLNEKFARVIPVLEEYLKSQFSEGEEQNYLSKKDNFFDWIDQSPDPDIAEFARKHIELKDKKSPSLSTLISRSIHPLESAGFRFGKSIPKLIQKRRGAMFHSMPELDDKDVRSWLVETQAANALLLFHTLKDLGLLLVSFCENVHALYEYAVFLKKGGA